MKRYRFQAAISPHQFAGSLKDLCKAGLVYLLILLLCCNPLFTAAAAEQDNEAKAEFRQSISSALEPVKSYLTGAQPGSGAAKVDPSAALQSLRKFSTSVLKDESLASILDEIIMDLLQDEKFSAAVQDQNETAAAIIRDPRLVDILGEVIAGYLRDGQLAADIEYLFGVAVELISHEELHQPICDMVAAFLENPAMEDTINGLIAAAVDMGYAAGAGTVAALIEDDRIPGIIGELFSILMEPAPQWLALAHDPRLAAIAEEISLIFTRYGPELTLNLLEDDRLREVLLDLFVLAVEPIPAATGGAAVDLVEHALLHTSRQVTDGTVDMITAHMIDDFFAGGAQNYLQTALNEVVVQSMARAYAQTPGDNFLIFIPVNIQKQIAEAIAEIPGGIARDGFFTWLVVGKPGLEARTYKDWALDFTGLLTRERAEAFTYAFAGALREAAAGYIEENQGHVFDALRRAASELPWEETIREIREGGDVDAACRLLVSRIFAHLPLEEFILYLQEDASVLPLFEELCTDLTAGLPFAEAGQLIREDTRMLQAVHAAVPRLELDRVASIIRHDKRIIEYLAATAADFPIGTVTSFLQNEAHAGFIGRTTASILLNIAADFTGDERLTGFINEAVFHALDTLEGSPGALILDFIAAFLDDEQFALYLAEAYTGFNETINRELADLFKLAVPNFFTRFIWQFL